MNAENQTHRERGRRLLKRINHWAIAGAIGLAGLFSFVAAETTHGKSTSSTTTTTSLQQPSSTPTASSSSSSSSNSGNTGNSGSSGSSGNTGSSSVVSGGS